MNALRILLGALGVAGGAFGAVLLLDLGPANLVAAGTWLVGGVLVHDAVLAPLTLAVGVGAVRLWRRQVPAAIVVGATVLATVTVVAIPVLGRFGARGDNRTLLDRNYLLGWLVLATLTVVAVAVAMVRSDRGGGRGPRAGGR